MTNKRNIITLLIMLSLSLGILAQSASTSQTGIKKDNNQYSSKLTIWDDINGVAQYMIMRETYLSTEYFSIKSTLRDVYIAKPFNVNDSYEHNDTAEYNYNGNGTNTEITSIKSYSYEGDEDLISLLDMKAGVSLGNEATEIGFYLINFNEPTSSYEIVLSVNPSIEITPQSFTDTDSLLESLEDESNYRTYLKKQILGSNFFSATDNNPFPLMEVDNDYTFRMSLTNEKNVSRNNEAINYNYFDVIYNRAENYTTDLGGSLIQNLFSIYFNNSKPLFHHYINEYMESRGDSFNYRDYRTLTSGEGEELVNKALTYLTWGVEHTPDRNYKTLNDDSLLPSQVVNSNDTVNNWLTTPGETTNRSKNYLGYDPEVIYEAYNDDEISYNEEMVNQLKDLAGEYFEAVDTRLEGIGLTTPFISGHNRVTGSSLPYVKGGMDSPRTFNYKMLQQYQIISDYLEDGDDNYKPWYGKDEDGWTINNHYFSVTSDGTSKSPGLYYFYYGDGTGNDVGYDPFVPARDKGERYSGLNLTGVDSLGLLSGALAMTSFYDEILGLPNRQKFIDLDNYYSMSHDDGVPRSPFLRNNGMPFFNREAFDATYMSNYENLRFNRMDIERSTVIVPNLKDIQPGDILVNTNGGETEVAIVVDSGYSEGDSVFHLSNVLVLSVNDIDKRVTLNYWGNGATYNSFTDRPKDYIARRLIKYNGEDINNLAEFGDDDAWDPFSAPIMNVNTHLTNSQNNYNRWIPNTGELFEFSSITFTSDDPELSFHNLPVVIGGLTDINYSTEESLTNNGTSGSNVNINRGDGFEFYAIIEEGNVKSYIKLATFNINTNSQNAQDRYLVDYVDEIFNSDGSPTLGFNLKTDGHTLYFYYQQGAGEVMENRTEKFGIRPLETNIRPGDDIVINFDLKIGTNLVSALGIESQALGVYDKKMLWRANLYIDDGSDDWNNKYPWNAPISGNLPKGTYNMGNYTATFKTFSGFLNDELLDDDGRKIYYDFNEWNRTNNGSSRLVSNNNEPEESDYLTGTNEETLGKQVVSIIPFTYHPKVDGATEKNVSNVVSYAYGCNDNPFEFNDEMRQQQSFYSDYFNKDKIKFDEPQSQWPQGGVNSLNDYNTYVADYPVKKDNETDEEYQYPNHAISLDSYTENHTTAINKAWENYITPFQVLSTSAITYTETSSLASVITGYSTSDSFPFLPGYALYHYKKYNAEPPNWANAISAGVDCIGFVSRSASYTNNRYKWKNVTSQTIKTTSRHFISTNYPTHDDSGDSIYISKRVGFGTPENLNKIKPGDIMYYTGANSSHMVMVSDIEDDGDNVITLNEIKLIESTWKEKDGKIKWAKVVNSNTLSDYSDYSWTIVRLKEE